MTSKSIMNEDKNQSSSQNDEISNDDIKSLDENKQQAPIQVHFKINCH